MRQREPQTDAKPLDPIALSLALWLGLMVSVLGLQRLGAQAALITQNAQQNAASGLQPGQAYTAWGG